MGIIPTILDHLWGTATGNVSLIGLLGSADQAVTPISSLTSGDFRRTQCGAAKPKRGSNSPRLGISDAQKKYTYGRRTCARCSARHCLRSS